MSPGKLHVMWMTLDLLVAKECRKSPRDLLEELEEWLESIKTSAKVDISEKTDDKVKGNKDTPTCTAIPHLRKGKRKKTRTSVKSSCYRGVQR
jgi:hypothetical protein